MHGENLKLMIGQFRPMQFTSRVHKTTINHSLLFQDIHFELMCPLLLVMEDKISFRILKDI